MKREATGNRSQSYCKPKVQVSATTKIKEGFFNLTTNISYRVGGGISRFSNFFNTESNKQYHFICIHGKKFHNEKQAKAYIKKIIWFSYRRMPGLTKDMHCDTGWGCLIRVGQMALAAGIKKHLDTRFGQKPQNYSETIASFVQDGKLKQKYSLKKIVEYANKKFQINYGDWFKTFQICDVLTYLHTNNPMKSASTLGIIHSKGGVIYLEQVFSSLNKKMCQCQKKRILCDKCNTSNSVIEQKDQMISLSRLNNSYSHSEIKKQKPEREGLNSSMSFPASKERSVLMLVSFRAGSEFVGEKQFLQIIQLLGLEFSLGIIGGVPGKGYYFIGFEGNELIYLDPHFVQDQVTFDRLHYRINSFSTQQMRKVGRTGIDPSMAFVFYIDSLQTLRKLQLKLEDISEKYQNPILMVQWVNTYKHAEKPISELQQDDNESNQLENSFVQQL